jgi:cytosine/adenosine deaminase-related metal-dependent hydrolase
MLFLTDPFNLLSKLLLICSMDFYSASRVYAPDGKFVVDGLLIMEGQKVLDLIDPSARNEGIPDNSEIQLFPGILSPGFVNAHCHLELSGLIGMVERGHGLARFIGDLQKIREQDQETMLAAAFAQDEKMFQSGIQAVGDICNSALTIPVKRKSKMYYHSFIELFSFRPEQALSTYEKGKILLNEFRNLKNAKGTNLSASLTPHAPYSTSLDLMQLMAEDAQAFPSSIHLMESMAEYEFLMEGKGVFKSMMEAFGIPVDDLIPYQQNPFHTFLKVFSGKGPLISVHNSFLELLSEELIQNPFAKDVYYCLCPRANQYIERVNPPVYLFRSLSRNIVLGTDSLASNFDLNLMEEVKQILSFEDIPVEEWLQWITINGALALGLEKTIGSFQPGKSPGLINILDDLSVKRIV